MSQKEIVDFLSKNKTKWLRLRDILKHTDCNVSSLSAKLKKLRDYDLVKWEIRPESGNNTYLYQYKE